MKCNRPETGRGWRSFISVSSTRSGKERRKVKSIGTRKPFSPNFSITGENQSFCWTKCEIAHRVDFTTLPCVAALTVMGRLCPFRQIQTRQQTTAVGRGAEGRLGLPPTTAPHLIQKSLLYQRRCGWSFFSGSFLKTCYLSSIVLSPLFFMSYRSRWTQLLWVMCLQFLKSRTCQRCSMKEKIVR